MEYLTVMLGRVSPLGVEVDAVVVRVPSHVIPVRKGCHRQWRRHRICYQVTWSVPLAMRSFLPLLRSHWLCGAQAPHGWLRTQLEEKSDLSNGCVLCLCAV